MALSLPTFRRVDIRGYGGALPSMGCCFRFFASCRGRYGAAPAEGLSFLGPGAFLNARTPGRRVKLARTNHRTQTAPLH